MTIFAQHGWGKSDKIEQGISNGLIEGVIMSPRDEVPETLSSYLSTIRRAHPNVELFVDPQFYVGSIGVLRDSKIDLYPHFRPDLIPTSFSPAEVQNIVRDTLVWQRALDVTHMLSPTVIVNDLGSQWAQIAMMLAQETVRQHDGNRPLLISIVVGEDALRQRSLVDGWLNDLTNLDVDGFYFVVRRSSDNYRQRYDPEVLASVLLACYSLSELNDYRIYCGYTDMVTLLMHAVGVDGTAAGWYFNLRRFTLTRFLPATGGRRPRSRYSSRPLLNSIYMSDLDGIYNGGQVANVLSATQFDGRFLAATNPENVNWPDYDSALHHWNVLHDISRSALGNTVTDRLNSAANLISQALVNYANVASLISFSNETGPAHLEEWIDGLNLFRADVGV